MTIDGRKSRVSGWQKMLRRKLVVALALCTVLFAFNFTAQAQQQKKIAKIGFIGVRPEAANYSAKFILHELQKLGYVEGKTFTFEYRTANNQLDRLPGIVDELIRLKLDVLITAATRELHVAKNVTKDLPLVSLNLGDPIASGLVQSLARPGGNITGFTPLAVELGIMAKKCWSKARKILYPRELSHSIVKAFQQWR